MTLTYGRIGFTVALIRSTVSTTVGRPYTKQDANADFGNISRSTNWKIKFDIFKEGQSAMSARDIVARLFCDTTN